jgi:hypothetical protein
MGIVAQSSGASSSRARNASISSLGMGREKW